MFTIIGADQKEYGPSSAEEIRDWIRQGRADGRTLARMDDGEWKTLAEFPEFSGFTAASGAPPRLPGAPVPPASAIGPQAFVLGADPDFDIGKCLGQGWSLMTGNLGLLAGGCMLIWLLDLVAQYIPFVEVFVGGVLYGGLYLLFLKCIRRDPANVGDALGGFGERFVQLLLAGLLTGILTFLAYFLCVLPSLYFKIAWSFALVLVIDKRLEFWTAMELSRKMVTRVWFKVFVLTLIAFAPYILIQAFVYLKIWFLMYTQMNALMTNGAPDFSRLLNILKEIAAKMQFLQVFAQVILLVNLPFATGALMYAYEALFGPRPAPAA